MTVSAPAPLEMNSIDPVYLTVGSGGCYECHLACLPSHHHRHCLQQQIRNLQQKEGKLHPLNILTNSVNDSRLYELSVLDNICLISIVDAEFPQPIEEFIMFNVMAAIAGKVHANHAIDPV